MFDKIVSHVLHVDDLKLYAKDDEGLKGLLVTEKIDDINMEFSLDKYAKAILKRGKLADTT